MAYRLENLANRSAEQGTTLLEKAFGPVMNRSTEEKGGAYC
jgi:hypothetical protein